MATLKLNIYRADDHNAIEKTYEAETFEIMYGTLEDFIEIIHIEDIKNRQQIAANIIKAFRSLNPLLKEIFDGVTDDELRRTKLAELIPLFSDIFDVALENLQEITEKNPRRA